MCKCVNLSQFSEVYLLVLILYSLVELHGYYIIGYCVSITVCVHCVSSVGSIQSYTSDFAFSFVLLLSITKFGVVAVSMSPLRRDKKGIIRASFTIVQISPGIVNHHDIHTKSTKTVAANKKRDCQFL